VNWNDRFLRLAKEVAGWSKDPSTQVGCVLVDDRRRVIGLGYNGFPRGVEDTPERLFHRPTKYLMVQHAEMNALLQCVGEPRGATAYVTHKPCSNCSGALIQAGIRHVVTCRPDAGLAERFADSFAAADTMLAEAGVTVEYVEG